MRKGSHQTEDAKRKLHEMCTKESSLWQSEAFKRKMREKMLGNTNALGHFVSEETRKKQHEANLGEKSPWYGKHHTEETRQKQRENHLGKKNPMYRRPVTGETKQKKREAMLGKFVGEKHPFWRKHHTEEAKEKIRAGNSGKNNPNYTNGKSREPYPLEWTEILKESIRCRDGYQCQLCSCPEVENCRKHPVHHIDYDKKNLDPMNLITLCARCNTIVNSNREFWTRYFQRKMLCRNL